MSSAWLRVVLCTALGAALSTAAAVSLPSPSRAAGGVGEACGGLEGTRCRGGLWCEPLAGTCDSAFGGVCVEVRPFCAKIYRPVCGCNGRSYGNDCERRAARVPRLAAGRC